MTNPLMKEIEKESARKFLDLYNKRFGFHFEIISINNPPDPDISCKDKKSGENLDLEITCLENLKGDMKKEFARIKGGPFYLGDSFGMRGNIEIILENLEILLEKKLLTSYSGIPTALVIRRIISLWNCREFSSMAGEAIRKILQGNESNFPKGIWIFCHAEGASGEDILNLYDV
jgi:hypothetical protein